MKTNWILAATVVAVITFASCGKDEACKECEEPVTVTDTVMQNLTDEEMYVAMLVNDRLRNGVYGEVKTRIQSYINGSVWENNAVKRGYVRMRNSYEYNQAGRTTKYSTEEMSPVSAEWTTDEQLGDVVVITNQLQPIYSYSYSYDSKNRVTEYQYQRNSRNYYIGSHFVSSYQTEEQHVIPASQVNAAPGTEMTVDVRNSYDKVTIEYDDEAKTGTVVQYFSTDGETWEEVSKRVARQDQYGMVNTSGTNTDADIFKPAGKGTKAFAEEPSGKTTATFDDNNNLTETYTVMDGEVTSHTVYEYTYF